MAKEAVAAASIAVITRHSTGCPRGSDPQWRRCNCRKAIYIYESGKVVYRSAKTRFWDQAERVAQAERELRDPVKARLREIEDEEAEKRSREAEKIANRAKVVDAVSDWLATHKATAASTANTHKIFAQKVSRCATEQGVEYLDGISKQMLDKWRGAWSSTAKRKDDRMGLTTQSHFLSRLKEFFRWAVATDRLNRDPSLALAPITPSDKRTMPLTPSQFNELLAATEEYDANQPRKKLQHGAELRAIFLTMRWSGLRLADVLALPRSALNGSRLVLKTKKTGAIFDRLIPDDVVSALTALPPRHTAPPDCFFWSRETHLHSLELAWLKRIRRLNKFVALVDDHDQPMKFHSHMLRDTYAVELLLAGVPLEDVSRLLTHTSVRVTEKYYAPWVRSRQKQLEDKLVDAMRKMGATVSAK
jgi:site-specific recombinase XerD